MLGFTRQFNDILRLAFMLLLLITVALAWFFYDTVNWYEDRVERLTSANSILRGYHQVSRLTHQEINALLVQLERGNQSGSHNDWQARAEALRETISRLRREVGTAAVSRQNASADQKSQNLNELAGLVEQIIDASALINLALEERRTNDATSEWSRLGNSGILEDFTRLIKVSIEDQVLEVRSIGAETRAGSQYIIGLLPALMPLIVITMLGLVWLFSRRLTRSLSALHDGARAFTSGELDHRIPKLKEEEFSRLAEALNTMAQELSDHRERLRATTARLETIVEERTRALKESNNKLADVDATRRKLLADISHEFRTPLTVIRGESDIVLRGGDKNEAEYRTAIQRILDQANHATRLIDDMLFIARADAGEPGLKLTSVSIFKLLHSLCNEFEVTARRRNITIEPHTKGMEAVVYGDTGRLRQVFAILMDNALRYSNPGGTVDVHARVTGDHVEVRFRDYGIGLTDEDAERVFERFYRGHQAQAHTKGTGLGLPVAKAIVEAHHGSITLKGRSGEGATATVLLPVTGQFKRVA